MVTVKLQKLKKSDRYCSFSPSWADLPIYDELYTHDEAAAAVGRGHGARHNSWFLKDDCDQITKLLNIKLLAPNELVSLSYPLTLLGEATVLNTTPQNLDWF